ncbi:MAG TPA: methionine--tRNA ligase [Candidatus Eisenbacteria bacterium]|nr:methionine--tRNA ligase [Candidatus Eisenbacteria bacterium]
MTKFYITCAIDYVNSNPHLGTAYEKIAADALARYHRMAGADVHFLMGTDEHSLNVERAAQKQNMTPKAYTDIMAERFEHVWKSLDLSHDVFIRTSEPRHHVAVSELFRRIHERGDIFKGVYKGLYCVSCEAFKVEKELVDGLCAVHRTKPEWIEEENWFFRLSAYQEPLSEHFRKHPRFLIPESRRNEILNVIEGGLEDLSVSRPGSGWGVPLPIDPTQRVYVWFDALINYITAIGFGSSDAAEHKRFEHWWPADLHVIGKDITRFHAVVWPAMLLSAGLPLPKQVLGHGWVTFRGERLSKSLGNIVDPLEVTARYGPDPLRFYLLKEVPLDRDGDFSWDLFIERYNSELANELGNLVSRSVTMAVRYFEGRVPDVYAPGSPEADLERVANQTLESYRQAFERHGVDLAIAAVWSLIRRANQVIEETAPWNLAKDPAATDRLATALNAMLEAVRLAALLLSPIMPGKCAEIRERLQAKSGPLSLEDARWAPLEFRPREALVRPEPLFPRIEAER